MDIAKILVIGLVTTIIVSMLKNEKPEIALQISLACGIIIFLMMLSRLTTVIEAMQMLASKMNINVVYLNTILKIIGIAYLASFGIEICNDAGQSSIGSKIEFAAKIFILILAIPILMAVMDMIIKIMP
jgi:stage III sporulation protein AD